MYSLKELRELRKDLEGLKFERNLSILLAGLYSAADILPLSEYIHSNNQAAGMFAIIPAALAFAGIHSAVCAEEEIKEKRQKVTSIENYFNPKKTIR